MVAAGGSNWEGRAMAHQRRQAWGVGGDQLREAWVVGGDQVRVGVAGGRAGIDYEEGR